MSNYNDLMQIEDKDGNAIPFSWNEFPDGQLQIKIEKKYLPETENGYGYENEPFNVKVALCNPGILDLYFQFQRTFGVQHLTVNYLYGGRCDKDESGDYYVANLADMLTAEFDETVRTVKYLAPHPDIKEDRYTTVDFNLPDCVNLDEYDLVVFPDESAQRRFSAVNKNCVVCEKERDQETGRIIKHVIPNLPDGVKKVILLDDLVDGGKSPLGVADSLKNDVKMDLFVFHGVLSNTALPRLLEKFDKVIVSNSLPQSQIQKDDYLDEDQKSRVVIFDVWN